MLRWAAALTFVTTTYGPVSPRYLEEPPTSVIFACFGLQGFSSSIYPYYLRPGTTTPYGSSGTRPNNVNTYTNAYGASQYRLTTPNVVQFVKNQFACSSATGGDLEDGGGDGSAGVWCVPGSIAAALVAWGAAGAYVMLYIFVAAILQQ